MEYFNVKIILNTRHINKKESADKKWRAIKEVQKLYKEDYNKNVKTENN